MNRALIVIDVQESFRARPLWEQIANPKIADPVNRLVRLARANGDLVVWVLHTEPGSGDVFDPALGHVRLLDELDQPQPGEPVLRKTSHNAFTTTNLQQLLTEAGVRELLVCGIRTEQCVETTTRVGSDLGYRMVFVTDATTTNPIGELGADAIIERTEAVLRDRFARIATVAELEAELGASEA
ncbi:cysteine hydrolase family protein [Microtetraspora malaysiensis]|uniref:cysteine hydrolase family protein n=1 Tax=Microtetraspora malaysiensis TaxID=161358 RepID=UPI003D8DE38A